MKLDPRDIISAAFLAWLDVRYNDKSFNSHSIDDDDWDPATLLGEIGPALACFTCANAEILSDRTGVPYPAILRSAASCLTGIAEAVEARAKRKAAKAEAEAKVQAKIPSLAK